MFFSSLAMNTSSSSCAASAAGRVAVITGANKGIGYFIALQLGMSGLFQHIILACRDTNRGQAALARMQPHFPSSVQASCLSLTLGNHDSHVAFREQLETYLVQQHQSDNNNNSNSDEFLPQVDVLVNNAAMAFKGSDPTPFAQQTKPTLDVNFRGTVDFTQQMLPLLRRAGQQQKTTATGRRDCARIVNVASMAGRLNQVSPKRQQQFSSPNLTMEELQDLMDEFETDVAAGNHQAKGWSNTNYGMSKLAVVAATKIWAREESPHHISVTCICPGYCATDMSSNSGPRSAEEGAKNAVLPATMDHPPMTGEFFADMKIRQW